MAGPPVYRGPVQGIAARTWVKRCILSVLQPLTGTRATGTATVKATGATVSIPGIGDVLGAAYAVPSLTGADVSLKGTDHMRLVKVAATTSVPTGLVGASVPITSVLGGAVQNLPAGTELRWSPAIPGIEPVSVVAADMTGGVAPTAPGTLQRITIFDKIDLDGALSSSRAGMAETLWRTRIGAFPAGILAWAGASRGERVGRGARLRALRFRLFVVGSKLDSASSRTEEIETALDYAEGLLEDRAAVDEEVFSQPSIRVGASGKITADDGSYVYFLDFETSTTIERIDGRAFADWLLSQEVLNTPTDSEYPDPEDAFPVVDQTHAQ